jgi:hypothetical protein
MGRVSGDMRSIGDTVRQAETRWRSARCRRQMSMAWLTARPAVAVPSVPTTMDPYTAGPP